MDSFCCKRVWAFFVNMLKGLMCSVLELWFYLLCISKKIGSWLSRDNICFCCFSLFFICCKQGSEATFTPSSAMHVQCPLSMKSLWKCALTCISGFRVHA